MKILILGGSGMAGHMISLYLEEAKYDVTTFSRHNLISCKNIQGDAKDFKKLKQVIDSGQYDAIINAIGLLNNNAEEHKSDAVLLNSYLPYFLSDVTRGMRTRIIHMSTDCVFSGKLGNYTENSLKDGESFYDRSKALGELDNEKDLTFRNSIIGPDLNVDGIGLFNWFMKQSGQIQGYSNVFWTGVTTLTLAKAIEQALESNLTGLYHLVNNEKISKYDLLILFKKYFGTSKVEILPNSEVKIDKSLVNNRTEFSFHIPSYDTMIGEMKVWIDTHKELYKHYLKKGE